MPFLCDFYLKGRPVELTASEYARLRGLTVPAAKGELTRMVNAGVLRRSEIKREPIFSVRYGGGK